MKTWLRNLAEQWADARFVKANDALRRKLIAAEAAVERLKQERDAANIANANLSTYNAQMAQLLNEAINENAWLRRVIDLARWWRAYDHAPDPDPEVWARTESALKRAIDAARDEADLMRPVFERAQEWHTAMANAVDVGVQVQDAAVWRASEDLCAAIHDLPAARDEARQDAPRPQCPDALLLDGVELHRCIRDGGHEGDHWNRGHQRQWPRVEVNENIEVPW